MNTVCVDFDGTVVTHEYPEVGQEVPNAVKVLKALEQKGVRIILWTMRHGDELQDAVRWYEDRGIELFGVNRNPEQGEWTDSPKAYAQLYIDDAAFGCPLRENPQIGGRPFVDWYVVEEVLLGKDKTTTTHS